MYFYTRCDEEWAVVEKYNRTEEVRPFVNKLDET
jgi:hypothetical protein